MRIVVILSAMCMLFANCSQNIVHSEVDYVDPLIGTAPATTLNALKHSKGTEVNSQVVPFVTAPFGMTNWVAQTRDTEEKCVAPYYYNDTEINGFRGSHWLSGSCVQDYGTMAVMPVSGNITQLVNDKASAYSHDNENCTPYLYSTKLDRFNIDAKMTATKRAGYLSFTYNSSEAASVIISPNSDEAIGFVQVIPEENEIVGFNPVHRIYQGWGEEAGFNGYFVARFSHDFSEYGVYHEEECFPNDTIISNVAKLGGYASFALENGETVEVIVGTSFTSIEQARKNLDAEIKNRSFTQVCEALKLEWNTLLGKVEVESDNTEEKTKFYTALYHCCLQPRLFNDVDGTFPSFAGGETTVESLEHDYYVDFSMWDTYRALHPLFNLLIPSTNKDMLNSLLFKGEQAGWLPIFPCWNSYTSAMIGDHVITTIADGVMKGVLDINQKQYDLLLQNAFQTPKNYQDYKDGKGRRALTSYMKYGYIPLQDSVKESYHDEEQVSRTLEYAFDDFTLSQLAKKRNDKLHYDKLTARALNYKNVYSKEDQCIRGRFENGEFTPEYERDIRMPYITEGTPFQYMWYVPHDVAGLMNLTGGEEEFNNLLDSFFDEELYWHGNEPGHQTPFLYNYSGQPWKTQEIVREIIAREYGTGVGGLSGNDDAGQMSAWYVFASLGMYPVAPGVPEYVISGPLFDKVKIHLENGKTVSIEAPGAGTDKNYIQDIEMNGKPYVKNYFSHHDLINGANINVKMNNKASKTWGIKKECRPYSLSK